MERAYTVAEIDRMRAAIQGRALRAAFPPLPPGGSMIISGDWRELEAKALAQAEDQLRTYLLAGVSPDELEKELSANRL